MRGARRELCSLGMTVGTLAYEFFLGFKVAEREGFEPSDQLPSRVLSKDVHSTTLPSLQKPVDRLTSSFTTEGEGFEPPVSYPTTVFKTAALSHSAIPPYL